MSSSSSRIRPVLVWFRNDLRIHDHDVLLEASKAANGNVLPVYCFDPRQVGPSALSRQGRFPKCGRHRTRFLLDSISDLRSSLKKLGADLIVRRGKPEDVLPELVQATGATCVYAHKEVCSEEVSVESRVQSALAVPLTLRWGAVTLCHLDDLPFKARCSNLPDVFTRFRQIVEADVPVRGCVPTPSSLETLPQNVDIGQLPTVDELCAGQPQLPEDPRSVLPFKGGETAARERLDYYLWKSDLIASYKETRNGLVGGDYSSKFSPWLAHGNLTARWIYSQVTKYERERTQNQSTYWLIFELLWRDYFRFVSLQHGTAIFLEGGVQQKRVQWKGDINQFKAWKEGRTGFPFVDANMRELHATGFMSNRGRQNVASFLTKDLFCDWRLGAEWFESMLLDHDPCSNYGNWNYAAGIGNDPRQGRHFNVIKQGKTYDDDGSYIRLWVPELASLPSPMIHAPFTASQEALSVKDVELGHTYPQPMIQSLDGGRLPLKNYDGNKKFKGPAWMKDKSNSRGRGGGGQRGGQRSGQHGEGGGRSAASAKSKSKAKGSKVQGGWA